MPLLTFLFEAVLISLSGVLMPGPITAITVAKGSESPHSGAFIAAGHGVVEFPLMISIYYGFGYLLNLFYVKTVIAFVGGLFLLFMSYSMFRSITQVELRSGKYTHSPLIAGIVLSAGNPYFLIWWATLGAALILRSMNFGILGFLMFLLVHWLCDFAWCYFLSTLSFKGGKFFGKIFQKVVFALCGAGLLFFSGKFIISALREIIV